MCVCTGHGPLGAAPLGLEAATRTRGRRWICGVCVFVCMCVCTCHATAAHGSLFVSADQALTDFCSSPLCVCVWWGRVVLVHQGVASGIRVVCAVGGWVGCVQAAPCVCMSTTTVRAGGLDERMDIIRGDERVHTATHTSPSRSFSTQLCTGQRLRGRTLPPPHTHTADDTHSPSFSSLFVAISSQGAFPNIHS